MTFATDCVCIECDGPWLRSSSNQGPYQVYNTDPINFYSAEINIFSPFGQWTCGVVGPKGGCQGECPGNILATTPSPGETRDVPPQVLHFCLADAPGSNWVYIQMDGTTASTKLGAPVPRVPPRLEGSWEIRPKASAIRMPSSSPATPGRRSR